MEIYADINRQLSLERMNNHTLLEEITRLRAKDPGETIMDKHTRININSKKVENKALSKEESNHNIMEEIASYRAKDSGKTMIDKDIQVNITTKNMEYDAFKTKKDNSLPLDNENSKQLENQWNTIKVLKHKEYLQYKQYKNNQASVTKKGNSKDVKGSGKEHDTNNFSLNNYKGNRGNNGDHQRRSTKEWHERG